MRKIFTLAFIVTSLIASALDPNHFTINRISAPYFIVDGNSPTTLTKAYVGFEVINNSNSATTYSGLKFTITSIGTSVVNQNYSVLSPASGIVNIGALAPGQSKTCYFYVSYPASVTPQATFNIQLSDNTAGNKTLSFNIRNRSSISANAGGTATQTFTNQDIIGGIIYDDVTYVVGNVQNNDESDFQVAVSSSYDPTKISLLGTQVTASSVPGINVGATDSLYFVTGNGSNGASITIRWTFKITGTNFTNYLLPCAGATSGSTNYKYALNTALGAGTPVTVSANANPLTISKTSSQPAYKTNATAVFTITISNPGAYGVSIDKIDDQLPTGFTFVAMDGTSQVTSANSTSIPSAGATGAISFEGGVTSGGNTSYYVPAGGTLIIRYSTTSSSTNASNLQTTVRDYVGTTEVGSANNTVSVSSTLPVEFISTRVSRIQDVNKLDWTTTGEMNCRAYKVERNKGNGNYEVIGEIPAVNNSGTQQYSFIDRENGKGTWLYRIRSVDFDAQSTLSRVMSVKMSNSDQSSITGIYPNPVYDHVTINYWSAVDQQITLRIIDVDGQLVFRQNYECRTGSNEINAEGLSKLNAGTYFTEIISATGIARQKLVRAK